MGAGMEVSRDRSKMTSFPTQYAVTTDMNSEDVKIFPPSTLDGSKKSSAKGSQGSLNQGPTDSLLKPPE